MTKRRAERKRTLASTAEVDELESRIMASALKAIETVSTVLAEKEGIATLAKLKFDQIGRDPLDRERPLNLIEQLNQTFTYLTTLRGVKFLLEHHPKGAPFTVNLGTSAGPDIVSSDKNIVAEVFAATSPKSNNKLKKDLDKVSKMAAKHKYVFYCSPVGHDEKLSSKGVTIQRLQIL